MLEATDGLPARAVAALQALEERTLAVDGGRLKLEWGLLLDDRHSELHVVLWWDSGELLGYLGLYGFGAPTVELVGMVDPAARRRGIATKLLDAALPRCRDLGYTRALLVAPRASAAGRALALGRGARLEHSEYALLLSGEPADGPTDEALEVRAAAPSDLDRVAQIYASAFGEPADEVLQRTRKSLPDTRVGVIDGNVVAAVRVERDGNAGGVYGLAVDPARQGLGIGRDILRRSCRSLRAEGAAVVRLEVAVDNERALGLYSSIGFRPVTTEDYYQLPLR